MREKIWNFFNRKDEEYDRFVENHQAKSGSQKFLYIFLHFVPGILAYVLIHFRIPIADVFGISTRYLEYSLFIIVTYLWYIILPFILLKKRENLSFKASLRFLNLNRFDFKGFFLVLPVILILMTAVSIPYMKYIAPLIRSFFQSIPFLVVPEGSIFKQGLYDFPAVLLLLMLIGNFLGEELYFRGYLMKKIGFFGSWTWLIHSVFFVLYHVWQAPNTYPMIGVAIVFGLTMQLRKNLYVLIALHLYLNLFWSSVLALFGA